MATLPRYGWDAAAESENEGADRSASSPPPPTGNWHVAGEYESSSRELWADSPGALFRVSYMGPHDAYNAMAMHMAGKIIFHSLAAEQVQ